MRRTLLTLLLSCSIALLGEDLPPVPTVPIKTVPVNIVKVKTVDVVIPEIKIPEVPLVEVAVSDIILADMGVPLVSSENEGKYDGITANVVLPQVATLADNMTRAKAFRELLTLFKDKKTVLNDSSAYPDSAVYTEWKKIYDNADIKNYVMEYNKLEKPVRMIAEARLPVNKNTLMSNLSFYKNRGYNSVLITFNGTENIWELEELVSCCRSAGMSPWFAFGGSESIDKPVFIAPATLRRMVMAMAKICDGILLGWRRTSLHLFLPDKPFMNYIIKSAREVNKTISVVGESYLGRTSMGGGDSYTVTTNSPANASGCLIVNVGFYGINPKVLTTLFSEIKAPKLVLVVGERPYYKTEYDNKKTFEENFKIKEDVENRLISAGAYGTITLHGDGSDGMYNRLHTDNIAQTGQN